MTDRGKRVLISADKSGSGKTTITCAILKALRNRGLLTGAGKCGPDYIDPMFHREVLDTPSWNYDGFFQGEDLMKSLFYGNSKDLDITVIEGVMGYYDGSSFEGTEGSTYEIAKTLCCPVILCLNAKGMSYTLIAVLKGLLDLRSDSNIRGVILNNVRKETYERLSPVIRRETGVMPLGFFPHDESLGIESRHLGLLTPDELEGLKEKIEKLGDMAEKCLDIDGILKIAGEAGETGITAANDPVRISPVFSGKERKKVAVARDRAFSFYYEDNIELIRKLGCDIEYFSPLRDRFLPEDTKGLIIGGGYPEHYAKELSGNTDMRESIRKALTDGLPCLAECGGFMYLHEKMEDENGKEYDMAGFLKGMNCYRTEGLRHFGYVTLKAETDTPYLAKDETVKAHEFHYWVSSDNGSVMRETKPSDKTGEKSFYGMHLVKNTLCGFPHIYYHSNPVILRRFVSLL